MYGYSVNTVQFWVAECLLTLFMLAGMLIAMALKKRFAALVFPLGRLLIRAAALIYQPGDTCYALSIDRVALFLFVSVFCCLMYRYPAFGYGTIFMSLWSLSVVWDETYDGIITYFAFGGELTVLGIECVATIGVHLLLAFIGWLMTEHRIFPEYDQNKFLQ